MFFFSMDLAQIKRVYYHIEFIFNSYLFHNQLLAKNLDNYLVDIVRLSCDRNYSQRQDKILI